jgi:F-type H+-transporting ATPase subunit beta
MKDAGVLNNMVMVYGQMNEPPGSRFRVGAAALTMAEYFLDDEHRDVLLLIDNIFRFIQAGMEVSGLLGEMPSRLGYQSTMGTDLSGLEERIANTHAGAITSIQAVYVPADDLTDPAAVHVFSHLSASIVLSRKRASEGLYPAIDLLQSSSKMATPGIVGDRHYNLAQEIRRTLAQYESLKDIVAMLGMEQLSLEDRNAVARARRLERFLTQPFFTIQRNERKACKPEGLAGWLRTHSPRRVQGLPGERALYDWRDWGGQEGGGKSARGEEARYETARDQAARDKEGERKDAGRPEDRSAAKGSDCEYA